MNSNKLKKLLPLLVLLVFLTQTILLDAQTPYSIEVTPLSAEAEQGESITYMIEITAAPGFQENIELKLDVSVLTISRTYELGTVYPPYPQTFEHTFTVPEEVPGGVTVNGKITATSGDIIVEEDVQLKIKGGNILESIVNMIKQFVNQIVEAINNLF